MGLSICVLAPPSLAPEGRMLWERSTYEGGVFFWGGKSVVKGLNKGRDGVDTHSSVYYYQVQASKGKICT